MASKDGRDATQAYRVRVDKVWYWVDPTAPAGDIEPGDTVVIYPVNGEAHLAVLQSAFSSQGDVSFASLDGERFDLPANAIAALHLASVDSVQ